MSLRADRGAGAAVWTNSRLGFVANFIAIFVELDPLNRAIHFTFDKVLR
jgi:hypothetical protein